MRQPKLPPIEVEPVDHFAKAEEFLTRDAAATPCSPMAAAFRERAAIHAELAHTEAMRDLARAVRGDTDELLADERLDAPVEAVDANTRLGLKTIRPNDELL